ncbi:hypothetical protein HK405_006772, partial [Cladochytrium tenue]
REAPLDRASQLRKQTVQDKIEQINGLRRQHGLAPLAPPSAASKAKRVDDDDSKWYHPTFNPHGPKKPGANDDDTDDGSESDGSSDDSSTTSDSASAVDTATATKEEPIVIPINLSNPADLATIQLPSGAPPSEAQFYAILELPEIRIPPRPPRPIGGSGGVPGLMPPHQVGWFGAAPAPGLLRPTPMMVPVPSSSNSAFVFRPEHAVHPTFAPALTAAEAPAAAVISAAPRMRDLQKELVALVPASLARKRKPAGAAVGRAGRPGGAVGGAAGLRAALDAAPEVDDDEDEERGGGDAGASTAVPWVPSSSSAATTAAGRTKPAAASNSSGGGEAGAGGGGGGQRRPEDDAEYASFLRDVGGL